MPRLTSRSRGRLHVVSATMTVIGPSQYHHKGAGVPRQVTFFRLSLVLVTPAMQARAHAAPRVAAVPALPSRQALAAHAEPNAAAAAHVLSNGGHGVTSKAMTTSRRGGRMHVRSALRLSIDQEQDAGNDGADAGDGVHDPSADAHAQEHEAGQDQIDAQKIHFN